MTSPSEILKARVQLADLVDQIIESVGRDLTAAMLRHEAELVLIGAQASFLESTLPKEAE